MQEMMDFVFWFLNEFPNVLLTPPISAFTGIALLFWLTELVRRMLHISN